MSALQDLLARQRNLAEASRQDSSCRPENEAAGSDASQGSENPVPAVPLDSSAAKEPYGVAQVVTPSGIEIYYQAGPKRLYRLRDTMPSGTYDVPWIDVPSMSEILDILDSPLAWWGMQTGVAGVTELVEKRHVDVVNGVFVRGLVEQDANDLVRMLQEFKLTTNDTVKIAQDRGTSVHGALEYWADHGTQPDPDVYPPNERGYVQGLKSFLYDSKAEPVVSERMVGSLELGFAGRPDLIADIPEGAHVFVHRTEKGKGDKCEEIEPGRYLLDLKTSKYVYKKHHFQLAGYRLGLREAWDESVDAMGVIHVLPDGRYQLKTSDTTEDDFRALKAFYDVYVRTQGR